MSPRTHRWIPAAAILILASTTALAAELDVSSARVKFKAPRRSAAAATASLVLAGGLRYEPALGSFQPGVDRLAATLGAVPLLDVAGLPAGARIRTRGDGRWVLQWRRPFGPGSSLRLTMAQVSGIFELKVKGIDGAALEGAGPQGVPFTLTLGEETWSTTLDFDAARDGSWAYARAVTPHPPGGGGGGGGSGGGGGGGGGVPVPVAFSTLEQGQFTPINTPTFGAYRDASSWTSIWNAHKWGIVAPPPAPLLDWSREMYVGVWIGGRSSGGYTAAITKVEVQGSGIIVHVTETRPGPNCVVSTVTTSPYHIIRMPRVDGTAQQNLTVKVVTCP